ncbi:ribokinase [Novosphingobium sp. 9]|uniref:ribokinase n=1 Tax=Novosphingobium sp. 9 TaxID=2025349 RepID=UPI0021B60B11|nr:ribokinase [Novosphingobium sp. 9]
MSVLVLGARGDGAAGEGAETALASVRFGSATLFAGEAAGEGCAGALAAAGVALTSTDEIQTDVRVVLASLDSGTDRIAALFASPEAAALRKILYAGPVISEADRADAVALFALSDMLIFTQSDFATFFELERAPCSIEDMLVVRKVLTRPNQAAVVMLEAQGAIAIWAERWMQSAAFATAASEGASEALSAECFCGVVAACVDQGIGPEAALRFANAAISMLAGEGQSVPERTAIEALLGDLPVG